MEESVDAFRPRVLRVRLGTAAPDGLELSCAPWRDEQPVLDATGRMGGAALALALCLADARRSQQPLPFVIAVGDAVRRGLPTAARATLAGVAPLSGQFVDCQLGGSLARRLARHFDALQLTGCSPSRGAVLVLDAEGQARLETHESLPELGLRARVAFLREAFPESGGLVVGPAGDAGVLFASLANLSDPPSFAGRGGLGARFAACGLTALVVTAEAVAPSPDAERLRAELRRSPRLFARGEGGTFELLAAFALSGDLRARGYREPLSSEAARALEREAARPVLERLACAGCPTACRHVIERAAREGAGSSHGARFSSTYALGANLGFEDFQDSLALLAVCDDVGVDARAAGAALALLAEARAAGRAPGPALWGEREACLDELRALGEPDGCSPLARGAGALARELGMQSSLREAKGLSARPVSSLAAVLGQCVSARGADPMRAFPFLAESGGDRERLAQLFAPLELPPGAFDPHDPAGKGRLVWWHENLAVMIDTSGFCAFSAAGLVGDGVWDLDSMAEWLALPGVAPGGRAWLAAGATLVLLQRELASRLGREPAADRPEWAARSLALAGMYDEYALLRGLDTTGEVGAAARELLGREALLEVGLAALAPVREAPTENAEGLSRAPGSVHWRAFGALGAALGDEGRQPANLPCTLAEWLAQLADARPAAAALVGGALVQRAGERLCARSLVRDGDVLDLVVAISGG